MDEEWKQVNVRLPARIIERIDHEAEACRISRGAAIIQLLQPRVTMDKPLLDMTMPEIIDLLDKSIRQTQELRDQLQEKVDSSNKSLTPVGK